MSPAKTPTPVILNDLTIPKPSIPSIAALKQSERPLAIFSDFDGTIFHQDTGHILFDNHGCGPEKREYLDHAIGNELTFREASEIMWGSLNVTLADALVTLKKNLVIDKDFRSFFSYCQDHEVPFSVISAGIKPLLRAALDEFLGKDLSSEINVVSNDGEISEDGSEWKAIWRHDSELGHDKAKSVIEFRQSVEGVQPLIVFIGDGVSDLAAASQADIIFARRGLKFEEYCIEHLIPYIPYDSFADILVDVRALVRGNQYHDLNGSGSNSEISTPRSSISATDDLLDIPTEILNSQPATTTPLAPSKSHFDVDSYFSINDERLSKTPIDITTTIIRPPFIRNHSLGTAPNSDY